MTIDLRSFELNALCPLDGRYHKDIQDVSAIFSEFSLIRNRLNIEILYLLFLSRETKVVRKFTEKEIAILNSLWEKFSADDALEIKSIEAKIKHDVKAIEYFITGKLQKTTLADIIPFIHIGLTSYDINIPAYGLMLTDCRKYVIYITADQLLTSLKKLITETADMVMLARTHGQPALPTTMGKEFSVFYKRLTGELEILNNIKIEAKLTGAVGNLTALSFVYPEYDWIVLSGKFISSLGLTPNVVTTQILPYDSWIRLFDCVKRINNILINFTVDVWWYISFEYFLQMKIEGEVGSSTMAQKINPIMFENAEGNLAVANSLLEMFGRKLAVSRLQRDLSDSTVKRDIGLAFGFTILAWRSIIKGLTRISPNPKKAADDLYSHFEIFAEGIQTYLRAHGYQNAYELLKKETRGRTFSRTEIHQLINRLPIPAADKKKIKINSLNEYLGLTKQIINIALGKGRMK